MKFTWEDYSVTYKDVVESWLDEEAKKFTGCEEGFEKAGFRFQSEHPDGCVTCPNILPK